MKRWLPILIIFIILTLVFSSIIVIGQAKDPLFEQIKAYDGEKFKGNLKMESTFPEIVQEIKIFFFKNGLETTNDTSAVKSGKWSYEADVENWPSGEYEVKCIAHDNASNILDQIIIDITIESKVPEGTDPGSVFDTSFLNDFRDKTFKNKIELEASDLNDTIKKIQITIERDGKVELDETADISKNTWKFEKDVEDWETGTYEVTLKAMDGSDVIIDSSNFNIKVEYEEPFYMPLFCAIILIIFIVLFVVFFILSILKHKKIMGQLRFDPKTVAKKLPMMSLMSMLITLLYVLAGTAAIITAEFDLITFILLLAGLGLLMLVTYWTFSNRNLPNFLYYLIFLIISFIVIILTSLWSPSDADGLFIGSGLVIAGLILFFISFLIYWLTTRRGFLIAMVTVILSLVFFIISLVFFVLAYIDLFVSWWVALIVSSILLGIILLIGWMVLKNDIFYFEDREESQTHRGSRKTLNMFDVLSTPRGLMKRDYDRKVMAKISYEKTHDKKVRMEVIQLREWDTLPGRAQGRRIMGVFVTKMRGKEGAMFNKVPVAESVKYSTYSSDTNLNDKLDLCRAFGFEVVDSGKERGLDYYDLDLVHKPFLGLGKPMGSIKPKKDYEKESGYKRDKEKKGEPDSDRDHRYDYDHDREQRQKDRERDSRTSRESDGDRDRGGRRDRDRDSRYDRDRDRDRGRDRRDDRTEDWSRNRDRNRDRDRDRGRRREPERRPEPEPERRSQRRREDDRAPARWPAAEPVPEDDHEPEPEKSKKRPPPPRIVGG